MAEKKRVSGIVDRIEGGMVIVVIRDPDNPEDTIEVAIPRQQIKKTDLVEGDRVTILL